MLPQMLPSSHFPMHHLQWFLGPPLEIELLILLQIVLSCSYQKGLESLMTVFLKFWAREKESKKFLLLTVAAILRTKSQRESFLLLNLLQLLVCLNRIYMYQAVSGNKFGLQRFCNRDPVLYDRVRHCVFRLKCVEDLRVNRAENFDCVWLSQSLCQGGSNESTRLAGFNSMSHAWWRKAKLLTWLDVPALIADFVDSHQSTRRNMLIPRNRLARVAILDCIDLPTRT